MDDLELRLASLEPSAADRGGALESAPTATATSQVASMCREMLDVLKRGISISSQTESYPLLPLYAKRGTPVPPEIELASESQRYEFYLVETVFSILLSEDEFARRAQFAFHIVDDTSSGARRSRPFKLFPEHKDVTYFNADLEGKIGVDATLNFQVPESALPVDAAANARLAGGLLFGPYSFKFRKAAIQVIGTGQSEGQIGWSYELASELYGANEFKTLVILKVPSEVSKVSFRAQLGVEPWRKRWKIFNTRLDLLHADATLDIELRPRQP